MKRSSIILIATAAVLFFAQCRHQTGTSDQSSTEASVEKTDEAYLSEGKAIVDTTFKTLSGALMAAMQEGGVEHAIQYCNVEAFPLTDALSEEYGVSISRKAERFRNPANQADLLDRTAMTAFQSALDEGSAPKPLLMRQANSVVYYHPILLQPQCAGCHGSKEQIGENYKTIAALYPDDRAIGFKPGELRGVWRVEF